MVLILVDCRKSSKYLSFCKQEPDVSDFLSQGVIIALDVSRKTLRRIRLTYFWAFGYNAVMIPIAAGELM